MYMKRTVSKLRSHSAGGGGKAKGLVGHDPGGSSKRMKAAWLSSSPGEFKILHNPQSCARVCKMALPNPEGQNYEEENNL